MLKEKASNMTTEKPIIGIMAAAKDGLVGKNKDLPWSYPSEMQHFKDTVNGHAVIMGRSSYEFFPKSLMGSCNVIILSRDASLKIKGAKVVNSLEECLEYVQPLGQKIFMTGGAQVAHLFLRHGLISSFILTIINKSYQGDTYIDLKFFDNWTSTILSKCDDYTIFELVRLKS